MPKAQKDPFVLKGADKQGEIGSHDHKSHKPLRLLEHGLIFRSRSVPPLSCPESNLEHHVREEMIELLSFALSFHTT